MATLAHVQEATLDRFIAGWSNWSAAQMVEPWSDDCTQVTMPFNMHHPPRTRSQVLETLPLVQKIVTNYQVSTCATENNDLFSWVTERLANRKVYAVLTLMKLTIHETVHDEAKGKAVVYAVSKADTPFGDWNNEYAVFFTFDDSREKIVKIEEMIDSSFLKEFFPKFQQYLRESQVGK